MGTDKGELSYWEGWPRCPHPLCSVVCSSLALSSAKKGSSEDKDDISKLVTGLMKTSICRQMSYKTVEGNEVRTSLSSCPPLFGGAGRTQDHAKARSFCRPPPYHAAVPALALWRQWWKRHLTSPCPPPSGGRWPAAVRVSNTCPGHPSLPQASCPALADSGAG